MQITLSENFRALFYAPFYAVVELGFAEREGIEVQFVTQSTPAAATEGLMDGSIDVSWGGPMRVLKSRDEAAGPPMVCFCEVVRRDPFYLLGKNERDKFTLADLTSLRLGSVSEVPTPWLCLQHDLRQLGLDPNQVTRVANRTMLQNLMAMHRRDLDIVQAFEPYATTFEHGGFGRIVHAAADRGETSYTTLLATRDGVIRKREALTALVRAVRNMQRWLAENSADELAITVAPYFEDVEPGILIRALRRYKAANLWATDTTVSRTGFAQLAAGLKSGGFIRQIASYEDCVADAVVGADKT